MELQPVWRVLHPYPEVAEGRVTEDSFVVSIGAIWENLEFKKQNQVDPRYLDPEGFYTRTHFTENMRGLLHTVIRRADGDPVQSIHHLQVGMGGGKSHTLLLLYYLARAPEKALAVVKREKIASHIPPIRAVVLDCARLNPTGFASAYPDGSTFNTLWGYLFKQLGAYDRYSEADTKDVSPGVPMLKEALGDKPTIILLDEIMSYVPNLLKYPRQMERLQAFLQALTTAVKETSGCTLVVTTPVGVYEEGEKQVTDILSRYCTPTPISGDREYKNIRRRALYTDDFKPLSNQIDAVAEEYERLYKRYLPAHAPGAADAIRDNYPFHPYVDQTLKNLKEKKEFQNVRDELRFLVGLIYSVHKTRDPDAALINTGHAQMEDRYVRGGTVSKLQDPILLTRLDTDLETRVPQIPEDIQPTARKVLSTIVLNSLHTASPLQQGVTEDDVQYALLTPNTTPTLITEALNQIKKTLWFVDNQSGRYTFGRPNLNQLVATWEKKIEDSDEWRGKWWERIQVELTNWHKAATRAHFTGRPTNSTPLFNGGDVLTWIHRSDEIPDDRDIKLILADYTVTPAGGSRSADTPEEAAAAVRDLYENCGASSRNFKNTVYFLVAGRTSLTRNGPVDYAKKLLALEEMLRNRQQLMDLIGAEGLRTIDSMKADAARNLYPSAASVYQWLVYPSGSGLAAAQLGPDRIQVDSIINIVEVMLRDRSKKVIDRVSTDSLVTKYWPPTGDRVEVKALVEGFYRRPEIEVVTKPVRIYESIREAVNEGKLVYTYGESTVYQEENFEPRDEGFLTRNPELSTVEIKAEDTDGAQLRAQLIIDGRDQASAPYLKVDLRSQRHRIRIIIPSGYEFTGWSDSITSEERELSWTHNAVLTASFRIPPPPPVEEVELSVYAVDVKANQRLEAHFSVNDDTYQTPKTLKVRKGKTLRITLQPPKGYILESWSDGYTSASRQLPAEVDTNITARLAPIQPGAVSLTGSGEIRDVVPEIRTHLTRQAKEVRITLHLSTSDLTRLYGALTMLYPQQYAIDLSAEAAQGKPLENLHITVQATNDKQGDVKTLLTQLRTFLDHGDVTLYKKENDFKPLSTMINETALSALEKTEGTITYRIIALSDASTPQPTRSLQGALKEFKRGE
jgi:hypothetical protein